MEALLRRLRASMDRCHPTLAHQAWGRGEGLGLVYGLPDFLTYGAHDGSRRVGDVAQGPRKVRRRVGGQQGQRTLGRHHMRSLTPMGQGGGALLAGLWRARFAAVIGAAVGCVVAPVMASAQYLLHSDCRISTGRSCCCCCCCTILCWASWLGGC